MFVTNHCIKFWSRRFIFNVLRVADPRALLSPVAQITGRLQEILHRLLLLDILVFLYKILEFIAALLINNKHIFTVA